MPTFEDRPLDNGSLHFFYKKLWPKDMMVQWLSYEMDQSAGNKALSRREFSLSLPGPDGEIYIRHLHFPTGDTWLERLAGQPPYPHKMDLGAIYSLPLSMRELQPNRFHPLEKEVVFDIDMNDYDGVRTCCEGKKICSKCWRFMTLAMSILDAAFREDYGFENILWVYSGRRGIHAWVCDPKARTMNNEQRKAMVNYLNVVNTRADGVGVRLYDRRKGGPFELEHPILKRARTFCARSWGDILREQNIFAGDGKGKENRQAMREHLGEFKRPFDECIGSMHAEKDSPDYSVKLWKYVEDCNDKVLDTLLEEIKVGFTYPRLDVAVTKDIGHLLKAPFCAHPGTGRVCVPIDPKHTGFDGQPVFDPKNVPTIPGLQEEYMKGGGETSLTPYLKYFKERFLDQFKNPNAENIEIED